MDGQEELGPVSVWRERAEATFLLALAWSDVNGFPRQLQQGRAAPGGGFTRNIGSLAPF